MAAVERNSDGSYDAVDSGGFGKDYHGQDAFGERIGGTGIGGSHFGGFEEGHVGLDKDNTGHYEKLSSEALAQTESMDKPDTGSLFDGSEEGEAEASSDMKDSLRDLNSESSEESSKVSSLDTGMLIGENEDEKENTWASRAKDYVKNEWEANADGFKDEVNQLKDWFKDHYKDFKEDPKGFIKDFANKAKNFPKDVVKGLANNLATGEGVENLMDFFNDLANPGDWYNKGKLNKEGVSFPDTPTDNSDWEKAKSSFDVERAKEKEEEEKAKTESKAEPGPNMSKASVGESDYLTKANKDSTKELPKETPSRNDYGNHAADTLKGAIDIIADNSTAKALGLKSVEEFARENGYDPDKLSTMKAYQKYQNEQIMKAIPKVTKKVGSYIMERIKDFFDPSQLPERIRNTIARYNPATLVGAAILSIQSGAGLQASIDQALTMVDPEDQTAVSDFLEDVLKDRDTVKDLGNAIDDALAPEENSNTSELDSEIVNIGRKDNTDYDDFNAGLGTTSDADVKVFIARNVKADPILRRMIGKIGK